MHVLSHYFRDCKVQYISPFRIRVIYCFYAFTESAHKVPRLEHAAKIFARYARTKDASFRLLCHYGGVCMAAHRKIVRAQAP